MIMCRVSGGGVVLTSSVVPLIKSSPPAAQTSTVADQPDEPVNYYNSDPESEPEIEALQLRSSRLPSPDTGAAGLASESV